MPTLDWLNRTQAFTIAARMPYRLLEEISVHAAAAPAETATPPALPAQADLFETGAAPATRPGASSARGWTIITIRRCILQHIKQFKSVAVLEVRSLLLDKLPNSLTLVQK